MLSNFRKGNKGSSPSLVPKVQVEAQENPLYSEGHSFRNSLVDLSTPRWFSDRYGSHYARDLDILFDSPQYGIQIAPSLIQGWVVPDIGAMMGCGLIAPQPSVYQKKGKVPAWLLFHTCPEFEARLECNHEHGFVVVMSSRDLVKSICHYEREIRDPSLGILKSHLDNSLEVTFKVDIAHKARGDRRYLPAKQIVKARFNPWYRSQLFTVDYT